MPTLAIIGSIVADILVETPRLPASGENLHVSRIRVMTGGKAANAATAFARLGGQAHLLGNTGSDLFGQEARAQLTAEGVDVAGVDWDLDAATGAGILLNEPDGATAFMIAPGANQTLQPAQVERHLRPLLPQIDGLLFNFESPADCLLLAAEMAQAQGIPIFVDAGPYRPYPPVLWRNAAILSPNEPETEALVGFAIPDESSALAAANIMLAQGPRAVVIKLGGRGALLATAEGAEFLPAFPIRAADSAGAGDAFTAGLVWAVLSGQRLPQAVRLANACGAIAASRTGTMIAMPRAAEVMALLAANVL